MSINASSRATGVGFLAILLWSGLALLTALTAGIPPFELLALSFGVAFAASLAVLGRRGPSGFRAWRQPWPVCLRVRRHLSLSCALFLRPEGGAAGRGQPDQLSVAAADRSVLGAGGARGAAAPPGRRRRAGAGRHRHRAADPRAGRGRGRRSAGG